jgi:hypothetical protein
VASSPDAQGDKAIVFTNCDNGCSAKEMVGSGHNDEEALQFDVASEISATYFEVGNVGGVEPGPLADQAAPPSFRG